MKLKLLGVLLLFSVSAFGQAVITLPSGNVSLGIGGYGELGNCAGTGCSSVGSNVLAPGTPGLPANANVTPPFAGDAGNLAGQPYGIYLASQNADSVTPGCFCEGWGAAYNGSVSGYSSNDFGFSNVNKVSFASTSTTATSVTSIGDLQISQAYAPAPGKGGAWLFQNTVTLTNTGTAAMSNLQYGRSTDWDVNPTEFNEIETLGGWPASALTYSVNDGFCADDPLTLPTSCTGISTSTGPGSAWTNTNFTQNGVADQGSSFVFNFGSLAPGASTTFDVFYGAADNNADALGALGAVGAQVYVLGYASNGPGGTANLDSGTWMFAFSGVGGTPIPPSTTPEPGSAYLFGTGLALLGALRWKAKGAIARFLR